MTDTPAFAEVLARAIPADGTTLDAMRAALWDTPAGRTMINKGDVVLYWLNEADVARAALAAAPQPEDDHPDIPDTPEERAYRKGWNEGFAAGHKLVPIDDPAAPQPAAVMQYYYKDNACPAEHSRAETCICWHDEGKGPFPDLKNGDAIPMAYGGAIGLTWRAAAQPAPERETCDACGGTGIAGHPDSGYTCHRCEGSGAAAPQPAVADREALVEVIEGAVRVNRYAAEAIADALLARGLRLPGDETMAWALVGDDEAVLADTVRWERGDVDAMFGDLGPSVRVAIRVVEGGDDAA